MKRLLFFFALMGVFMVIDAGPRLDVDVGVNSAINIDMEISTDVQSQDFILKEVHGTIVFNEVGSMGAQHPGDNLALSSHQAREAYNYAQAPADPAEDTQGVNINDIETTANETYLDKKAAMVYDIHYQPCIQNRNDLKMKGVEYR